MIKNKSAISINVLLVLVILTSLLVGIIGPANAWFKAGHGNGVQMIINVGDIKLKLYQIDSEANRMLLNTNEVNSSATEKKYINLVDCIAPDIPVNLKLELENKEAGSADMYVKFKFQLFVRGVEEDKEISVTVSGENAWSDSNAGFKLNESDKYYYYCSADGNHAKLKYNTSVILMEAFTVACSEMYDEYGNALYVNSESVYIKLTVDAGLADFN